MLCRIPRSRKSKMNGDLFQLPRVYFPSLGVILQPSFRPAADERGAVSAHSKAGKFPKKLHLAKVSPCQLPQPLSSPGIPAHASQFLLKLEPRLDIPSTNSSPNQAKARGPSDVHLSLHFHALIIKVEVITKAHQRMSVLLASKSAVRTYVVEFAPVSIREDESTDLLHSLLRSFMSVLGIEAPKLKAHVQSSATPLSVIAHGRVRRVCLQPKTCGFASESWFTALLVATSKTATLVMCRTRTLLFQPYEGPILARDFQYKQC